MQLNVSLRCGSLQRSFFVTCENTTTTTHTHTHTTTTCNPSTRNPTTVTRSNVTTRNFKWLAKAVYHRYTVFVPETDKYTPSLMQQRITTWPNSDPEVQDPMFFSPPIDGLLSEYVSDGDLVICHMDIQPPSNDMRIKFYIKYTGNTVGRTYIDISHTTQEKLTEEFKHNRFHQFQIENKKKLNEYINKKLAPDTSARNPGTTSVDAPHKVLTAHPPSPDVLRSSHVSTRFRRRQEEKDMLKQSNKPLYDYDPNDSDDDDDLFEKEQSSLERTGAVLDNNNHEDNNISHLPEGVLSRRRRQSQSLSSRQVSIQLRRMSSKRIPLQGFRVLRENSQTGVRSTVLQMFQNRKISQGGGVNSLLENNLNDQNDEIVYHSPKTKFIKPNGPISMDKPWRQSALSKVGAKMKPAGMAVLMVNDLNRGTKSNERKESRRGIILVSEVRQENKTNSMNEAN